METQLLRCIPEIIAVASIVHIILPPYETFNDFPRLQKYYKLGVAIIAYIALNARGQVIQMYGSVNPKPTDNGPPKVS